jgi:hypothetical protein
MKIKVGKLETPYHKIQLKFAGLESLMTEDLQEQLIQPATSHKYPVKDPQNHIVSKEEAEQLADEMSTMMAQSDDPGEASTPDDFVIQRVKKYMYH